MEDTKNKSGQTVAMNNLAVVLRKEGRADEAEAVYKQVAELADTTDDSGREKNAARNKAAALNNLARNYREKQQFDKAEPLMKQAVELLVSDPTVDKADVIIAVDNLAMV